MLNIEHDQLIISWNCSIGIKLEIDCGLIEYLFELLQPNELHFLVAAGQF